MENSNKPLNILVFFGLILGIGTIILRYLGYLVIEISSSITTLVSLFTLIFTIFIFFVALKQIRDKSLSGYISYGKAFGYGVVLSFIEGIFVALYVFMLYKYIDPELMFKELAMTENKLMASGLPQEEIDKILKRTMEYQTLQMKVFGSFIWCVVVDTVLALILSAIIKKNQSVFDK